MTDLYRKFYVESRALKNVHGKALAGQAYDNVATTIHFEYSDLDFLLDGDDGQWIPYIVFDVYDDKGIPYAYGPNSSPKFDGFTFDIPWDITSNATNGRIQYQLMFSKTQYEVDDRGVAIIKRGSNLLSAKDGIVLKESIAPKKCAPKECRPPPMVEPSIKDMVDMFARHGLVAKVQQYRDPNLDRVCLRFYTYTRENDHSVALNVPYLNSKGRIASQFFDIISDWLDENGDLVADDENMPSSRLVWDSLQEKIDKASISVMWPSDNKDLSNERIPSEELVKRSLDKKVDDAQIVSEWSNPLSDDNIPSERLVKTELDRKTSVDMAVGPWDPDMTYRTDSTVIFGHNLYISLRDDNRNNQPDLDEYYWKQTSSSSTGSWGQDGVFITFLGDGVNRKYTVEHNLGTPNLFVSMRMNDEDRNYITGRICAVSPNMITIETAEPMPENGVVLLLAIADRTRSIYCGNIGNGVDTEYIVTHNLGSFNFFPQVRSNDGSGEYIECGITALNPTQVKLTFTKPVRRDGVTVMLSPYIPANWEGRWVEAHMDPMDVWVVRHDLCRLVDVSIFDLDGNEVMADVKQDFVMLDKVTVSFSRPFAGYAILR